MPPSSTILTTCVQKLHSTTLQALMLRFLDLVLGKLKSRTLSSGSFSSVPTRLWKTRAIYRIRFEDESVFMPERASTPIFLTISTPIVQRSKRLVPIRY